MSPDTFHTKKAAYRWIPLAVSCSNWGPLSRTSSTSVGTITSSPSAFTFVVLRDPCSKLPTNWSTPSLIRAPLPPRFASRATSPLSRTSIHKIVILPYGSDGIHPVSPASLASSVPYSACTSLSPRSSRSPIRVVHAAAVVENLRSQHPTLSPHLATFPRLYTTTEI
ncbi:hypothetical protein C8F01DRAFT_1267049 [Mycena amicta]|nr:hypothetical protein C8F01DRAFT_1267049 [Mycena amicta]